jgi:outer membrane protein assembly factor BamB
MRNLFRAFRARLGGTALALLAVMITVSNASSAPQWAMFRGDAQRTGRANTYCTYDPTVELVFRTGSGCSASPVVAEDATTYYGAYDRCFYGIGAGGSLAWPRFATSDIIVSSSAIGADGSVYFGTTGGALYALNPDGTAKWPAPFRPGSQAISGAIAVLRDGSVCYSSDSGYVYSVNPATGQLRWSRYVGGQLKHGVSSSPNGSVVYTTSSDGYLYAINADGSLRWKSALAVNASNTCAVGDDGTIFVGGTDCNLYAINPNGSRKWARRVYGKITTAAAVARDGSVYFGSADLNFYAVNPDGTVKWVYWARETIYSAPVIDAEGTLIFGTTGGNLRAFNSTNGAPVWTRALGAGIYSSPAVGRDGSIYVLDSAGALYRLSGPANPEPSALAVIVAGMMCVSATALRRRARPERRR